MSPSSRLKGQDLFDSRLFQDAHSTTVFYQFISSLRQKVHNEVKDTSATHKFIKTLKDGGRLMRCYTQNIDSLEARDGLCLDLKRGKGNKRRFMKKHYEVPMPQSTVGTDFDAGCEVVQLHGDLETLRCTVCATQFTWTENETEIFEDGCAPKCVKCSSKSDARQATGKRGLSVGSLRPNIVLYGEDHPSNTLINPFPAFDAACQPEVLIIMGTSLKVYGLQKIVREFAKAIHSHKNGKGKVIFINRTRPAESIWENVIDAFVPMDCDDWITDLRMRRPDLWLRQGEIDLKVTKPKVAKRKRKSEIAEDDSATRPAKKVKITVEIPAKKPVHLSPLTQAFKQVKAMPSTPRHQKGRPRIFQVMEDDVVTPSRGQMRTPRRPPVSPITPGFSPVTPRELRPSPLQKALIGDETTDLVIPESDHSEDEENRPFVKSGIRNNDKQDGRRPDETPSKGAMGRMIDVGLPPGKENIPQMGFAKFRDSASRSIQQVMWGDTT